MSIADKYRPNYAYSDYQLWEGRWELIDGMPYAMSPLPIPGHQDINLNLAILFKTALKESCDKCKVYMPIDWKISYNTVVQPDLLIVSKKIKKNLLDFAPSLTVEILSPSTAVKDRHVKFELYETEGVPYYIIVDPKFKKIDIYELKKKKYQLNKVALNSFIFKLEAGCEISVDFADIWP